MKDYKRLLMEYMDTLPVIDTHSHLMTEEDHLSENPDVFTRVLSHYTITNVQSAGFQENREWLKDTNVPFAERWAAYKEFFEDCKQTGYVRAALKTAEVLYGIGDINDDTVEELNARIRRENTAGLFHRVLREKCNIRSVINLGCHTGPYVPKISWAYTGLWDSRGEYAIGMMLEECPDADSIDMLVEKSVERCARDHVGIKLYSTPKAAEPLISQTEAEKYLALFRSQKADEDEVEKLAYYVCDRVLEQCGKKGLIVCVHAGLVFCPWENYDVHNPRHLINVVLRHPETKFDIYHGVPWMRDMAVMGNQFPNVYLNLVWAHHISPYMVQHSLDEWLDLVPVNKVIGFGGDAITVEKTYGALWVAKDNIATVLAKRCENDMGIDYAKRICRKWLYENPVKLYRLEERGFVDQL